MATAAGIPRLHGGHVEMLCSRLEREALCVAVNALVHTEMEFMAEFNLSSIVLEGYSARLEAFMTTIATAGNCKGVLVIMADAARFPLFHVGHSEMSCPSLVWEDSGMAILAAI